VTCREIEQFVAQRPPLFDAARNLYANGAADVGEHRIADLVEDGVALLAPGDHARLVHERQVARHVGLAGAGLVDDRRNLTLGVADRVQDLEPGWLGEEPEVSGDGSEYRIEVGFRRFGGGRKGSVAGRHGHGRCEALSKVYDYMLIYQERSI